MLGFSKQLIVLKLCLFFFSLVDGFLGHDLQADDICVDMRLDFALWTLATSRLPSKLNKFEPWFAHLFGSTISVLCLKDVSLCDDLCGPISPHSSHHMEVVMILIITNRRNSRRDTSIDVLFMHAFSTLEWCDTTLHFSLSHRRHDVIFSLATLECPLWSVHIQQLLYVRVDIRDKRARSWT